MRVRKGGRWMMVDRHWWGPSDHADTQQSSWGTEKVWVAEVDERATEKLWWRGLLDIEEERQTPNSSRKMMGALLQPHNPQHDESNYLCTKMCPIASASSVQVFGKQRVFPKLQIWIAFSASIFSTCGECSADVSFCTGWPLASLIMALHIGSIWPFNLDERESSHRSCLSQDSSLIFLKWILTECHDFPDLILMFICDYLVHIHGVWLQRM